MRGLFLSYRRADTQGWAGHLQEALRARLGDVALFYDLEAIAPGKDYVAAIEKALASCRAVLVLIGPRWLDLSDKTGRRRLDDPKDTVRLEIAVALRRRILVVPVLLGGAAMPGVDRLPGNLKPLHRRNGYELSDRRWGHDCDVLASALVRQANFKPKRPDPSDSGSASVQVGVDAVLEEVEAGDIAGFKGSDVPLSPRSVNVAHGARIRRSRLGDIVGIKLTAPKKKR